MRDLIALKQSEVEEFDKESQGLECQLINEESVKRRLNDEVAQLNDILAKEISESNQRQNDLTKLEGLIRNKENELEDQRLQTVDLQNREEQVRLKIEQQK